MCNQYEGMTSLCGCRRIFGGEARTGCGPRDAGRGTRVGRGRPREAGRGTRAAGRAAGHGPRDTGRGPRSAGSMPRSALLKKL